MKLIEKIRTKTGILVVAIIVLALITSISLLIGNSGKNDDRVKEAKGKDAPAVVQSPKVSQPSSKVEVQPIVTPRVVEQTGAKNEQTSKTEHTQVLVKSIQEGQKKVETTSMPPKPTSLDKNNDKEVKPSYKLQQSQPRMGDKNSNGQVYIEGFGWVEDKGGGGNGKSVGKSDDQLTGNKVGSMD